jgi:hypothetical protein
MSMTNHAVIANRLTRERLGSYLGASAGDLDKALVLYDWNTLMSGALHEDIGRVEVVLRNALDQALTAHGQQSGWSTPWYQRRSLFPGRHGQRALADISTARDRATRRGSLAETQGKVVAELTFGFWRFLCTAPYFTSLWVPVLAAAFPNHPAAGDPRQVRADIDDRVQRVHFLRNRVAHHEPIHHRDLNRDHEGMIDVLRWICTDTSQWATSTSRSVAVLALRP